MRSGTLTGRRPGMTNGLALRPMGQTVRLKRPNVRSAGAPAVMYGYAAVFDQWTEIKNSLEGHFLERLTRGSFAQTIAEDLPHIRVLFNHGGDSRVGEKVLGKILVLREDARGVYYEVELFDTEYNREILPGLQAGQYGASFRFRVTGERWNDFPAKSDYNPRGIPERTITGVRMIEFGPVTFPAYKGATAGVRQRPTPQPRKPAGRLPVPGRPRWYLPPSWYLPENRRTA